MWWASLEPAKSGEHLTSQFLNVEGFLEPCQDTPSYQCGAWSLTLPQNHSHGCNTEEDEKAYDVELQSFHEPEKEPQPQGLFHPAQ